jgi:hypothetical protein
MTTVVNLALVPALLQYSRARAPAPHGLPGELPETSLLSAKGAGGLRLRRGFTS